LETDEVKEEIRNLRKAEEEKKMKALEDDKSIIEGTDDLSPEQYMM